MLLVCAEGSSLSFCINMAFLLHAELNLAKTAWPLVSVWRARSSSGVFKQGSLPSSVGEQWFPQWWKAACSSAGSLTWKAGITLSSSQPLTSSLLELPPAAPQTHACNCIWFYQIFSIQQCVLLFNICRADPRAAPEQVQQNWAFLGIVLGFHT